MSGRIFIVSQTESFLTKRGQRHPDLAKYLALNSVPVVYVSSNFYHAEKRYFSEKEISESVCYENISHLLVKVPSYFKNLGVKRVLSNFLFALKASYKVNGMICKDDVIVIASRPVEQVFFFSLMKRSKGVRLILDVRDIWPDALNIGSRFTHRLFRTYCNIYLKSSVKSYDEIVHTCPSFTSWIERYTNSKQSTFIPLGYNDLRFKDHFLTKPRTFPSGQIKIVMLGLFQKQLNVIPMIKAMNDYPNIVLHFYGDDGTGEMFAEVESEIRNARYKNVKICGSVRSDLVPEVLKSYDLGVIPMDAEHALPNKTFDYIAMSLPIYALGNNDATKLVERYSLGWASNFNISSIRESLMIISKDSIKYNESAINVFEARDLYSRDFLFKQMDNIISNEHS